MGIADENKGKELVNLIKKAKNGDINALNTIISMFQSLIVKNSYINGKIDEDCIQELNIELIKSIKRFEFQGE